MRPIFGQGVPLIRHVSDTPDKRHGPWAAFPQFRGRVPWWMWRDSNACLSAWRDSPEPAADWHGPSKLAQRAMTRRLALRGYGQLPRVHGHSPGSKALGATYRAAKSFEGGQLMLRTRATARMLTLWTPASFSAAAADCAFAALVTHPWVLRVP